MSGPLPPQSYRAWKDTMVSHHNNIFHSRMQVYRCNKVKKWKVSGQIYLPLQIKSSPEMTSFKSNYHFRLDFYQKVKKLLLPLVEAHGWCLGSCTSSGTCTTESFCKFVHIHSNTNILKWNLGRKCFFPHHLLLATSHHTVYTASGSSGLKSSPCS